MPQNFDQDRRPVVADADREFSILGQTFTIRKRVRPEVLGQLDKVNAEKSIDQNIGLIDKILKETLVERDRARWDELRARDDDDAIELGDMQKIIEWAVEKLTDRPLDNATSSPAASTQLVAVPSPVESSSPVGAPLTG